MDEFSLDFGGVGVLAPEGIYRVRLERLEHKPSDDPTQSKFTAWLVIDDPNHDEWNGQRAWDNSLKLTPDMRWKWKQLLECFTGETWDQDNMRINPERLENSLGYVRLVHNEYQGRVSLQPEFNKGYLKDYRPGSFSDLLAPQQMPSAGLQPASNTPPAPPVDLGNFRLS